jgi:hypothetical protein
MGIDQAREHSHGDHLGGTDSVHWNCNSFRHKIWMIAPTVLLLATASADAGGKGGASSGGKSSTAPKTVVVQGYTKKDGTHVESHKRAAPSSSTVVIAPSLNFRSSAPSLPRTLPRSPPLQPGAVTQNVQPAEQALKSEGVSDVQTPSPEAKTLSDTLPEPDNSKQPPAEAKGKEHQEPRGALSASSENTRSVSDSKAPSTLSNLAGALCCCGLPFLSVGAVLYYGMKRVFFTRQKSRRRYYRR